MIDTLKKALSLLANDEKKSLYVLTFFMFIMGLFEVVGIASMLPFMSLAMNPEEINNSYYLSLLKNTLNLSLRDFIVFLGSSSLILLVTSGIVQILVNKKLHYYVWGLNHTLSLRLVKKYLKNNYDFFLDRNSSELTKNIITEVQQVVYGIYLSLVLVISRSIIVVMILLFLLLVNPFVSLLVGIVLVGGYFILYSLMKNKIKKQGQIRTEAHKYRFKAIAESIGGIKEVKLSNKEDIFLKNFEQPSKIYSLATAKKDIYPLIPRYVMEVLAIGGVLLAIVLMFAKGDNINSLIPIATVFVLAGYKLMPSLQMIFRALSDIKYSAKPLDILYTDLYDYKHEHNKKKQTDDLIFSKKLSMKNISFSYSKESKDILDNITLDLEYGRSLAIKGTTGSGKTTLVDILLGLLKPTSGYIEVDGVRIDDSNLKDWQQNIAYVPQFIFLLDDTISSNIAFGDENIDMEKVKWAANQAMLDDVIQGLDNGFETQVGEDGVRLSGGQRQRIGLARALYRKPRLLVLDEATSALDEDTEKRVMSNIYKFSERCAIIMIAHRLSTIEKSDQIIDLKLMKA
jgi:ATP-binding cassette, subfamily B, bacterial PglK